MTGLEQSFYIVSIVYMGVMLLLVAIGVVTVLMIRAKVHAIHRLVEQKLSLVGNAMRMGGTVFSMISKAKKVLREHRAS